MDWFSTLIKTTKDYLSANGLVLVIVIVVTASITTILGHVIPAFGRFMRYLPQRIWGCWRMFKKWLYWRHYHPTYTFINNTPAVISTLPTNDSFNPDPTYQITIGMCLNIRNNDNVNTLYLNYGQSGMSLRMYSKTEKRAKYILCFASSILYKVIDKERVFQFVFTSQIDRKPKVGGKAHCDKINIGIVQLSRMSYKLKGKPFDVKVDWSKIQVMESQNDTA